MSIASEISRLQTAKTNIKSAIEAKGVTVGSVLLSDYAFKVAAISQGIDTSDATATAADIIKDKTAYANGVKLTGTLESLDWIRPFDWLEIDSLVTAGEQKTVGLYAIYPNDNTLGMTNKVAFTVTGNHTIDWGDGSALENVNSNVQAEHAYDYDTISSATACSRGYRQVRITITPQSGQNITNLQFGKKHSTIVHGRIFSQWLDINISGTELTTFRFSETSYANLLEKVKVYQVTNKCTSCANMFRDCSSLQSLNLSSFNTAAVTSMATMFFNCYSMQSLNLSSFNTAAVTNMTSMFSACNSLQSLNLSSFNTAAVTNMASMFSACSSLQSLNLSSFNTAAVLSMASMFGGCSSLQYIDLSSFNTAAVTSMQSMFQNCSSLQSLNLSSFNTAAVTSMAYMFQYCYSLQSIDFSATNVGAVTAAGNFSSFTASTSSLIKCRLPQAKWSFTVANNPLTATELNLLFGDLATVSGQTITITGCIGAATCDKTIATNKGWTVTG